MDYYNQIAKGYNELHFEEQLEKLSIVKKNLKTSKRTKILDVGCGTGISSNFDCFVVGMDKSIELLKQNKSRKKTIAACENIPFKNNTFDYVISITSIHHFANLEHSLSEIKRVSRGNYIISILKKSKKFSYIKETLIRNFKLAKEIEEKKDVILFLADKS